MACNMTGVLFMTFGALDCNNNDNNNDNIIMIIVSSSNLVINTYPQTDIMEDIFKHLSYRTEHLGGDMQGSLIKAFVSGVIKAGSPFSRQCFPTVDHITCKVILTSIASLESQSIELATAQSEVW